MKKVARHLKLVLLFLLGFLLMAVHAWAVTPELVWEQTYDVEGSNESSKDVAVDGSGNVYVAGDGYKFTIIKYDPSGNVLWTRSYYEGRPDYANGIAVDGNGNVYMTGTASNFFCVFNSCMGDSDILTVKYDSAGNLLWAKTYNNNALEYGKDITVDVNGNVYVTGFKTGLNNDFLTIKYDASGNLLWAKTYDSAYRDDQPEAVAVDANGNIYVTGKTDESCCASRYLTLKYNSSGSLMWAKIYDDGDIYSDKYAYDISVDGAGNVYVAGTSYMPESGRPFHLVKYDSSGNQIWARISETWLWREVKGLSLDSNENILVSGTLYGSAYYTSQYDPAGNLIETKTYGANVSGDQHSSTVVDGNGNIYITGNRVVSYTYPVATTFIYTQKYGGVLTITTDILALGMIDRFYSHILSAAGGVQPYLWSVSTGTLPNGLTINSSTGEISGSPVTAGTFSFTAQAADTGSNNVGRKPFSITVYEPLLIATSALPSGPAGLAYSASLAATGGLSPYAWSIIYGSLPSGLSLNGSTGTISGTPTTVGNFGFTVQVTDANFVTTTKPMSIIVTDSTPPSSTAIITGVMGNNGWYVSNVGVALMASDSESGVKEIQYSIDGTETVVAGSTTSFTLSTDGIHSITYYAIDNANNSEAAHPLTINVDKTPPAITITGIANGSTYILGGVPTAGYTVTDNASGVATQSATGGNENGVGTFTYTVNAADNAGNVVTVSATYSVVYGFSSFLEPISLGKPFKLGSTIPVKFRLTDAGGNYISTAVATISVQQYSGDDPIGDPIILSANGADSGNTFRYDAADNLYIFNFGTKDMSQGTWHIQATLDDGTVKTAFVQLKRN